MRIVPGISTRDTHAVPDVMRGEETQIVGAVDEREERVLVVMPGTHSKWARVESGRIVDFQTFMTGELWSVLLNHSILGRLAGPAPQATGAAYLRGVELGLGAGNLAHDIFGARTLALMGELAADEVADWLSGVLIGREVRNARTWAHRNGYDGSRGATGGRRCARRALRHCVRASRRGRRPRRRRTPQRAGCGVSRSAQVWFPLSTDRLRARDDSIGRLSRSASSGCRAAGHHA